METGGVHRAPSHLRLGADAERRAADALRPRRGGSATRTGAGGAGDLPAPVALAGRSAWTGIDAEIGPGAMAAIVHLHDDEASRESPGYRRTWNGVLRLFNLLQFLPGAWWTTRRGARSGLYPEFAPAAEGPAVPGPEAEVESGPPPGEDWKEAIRLAAPETRSLLAELSGRGTPVPEVGFELTGDRGTVIAEAELAWPAHGVAVLLPDQEAPAAAFTAAGWRVFDSDDEDLREAIASVLAKES